MLLPNHFSIFIMYAIIIRLFIYSDLFFIIIKYPKRVSQSLLSLLLLNYCALLLSLSLKYYCVYLSICQVIMPRPWIYCLFPSREMGKILLYIFSCIKSRSYNYFNTLYTHNQNYCSKRCCQL